MAKESPEFEVLLKHVDRAGIRAVVGAETDEPEQQQAATKKKQLKPEVVSPEVATSHVTPSHAVAPSQDRSPLRWVWLGLGFLLGAGAALWVAKTFY